MFLLFIFGFSYFCSLNKQVVTPNVKTLDLGGKILLIKSSRWDPTFDLPTGHYSYIDKMRCLYLVKKKNKRQAINPLDTLSTWKWGGNVCQQRVLDFPTWSYQIEWQFDSQLEPEWPMSTPTLSLWKKYYFTIIFLHVLMSINTPFYNH